MTVVQRIEATAKRLERAKEIVAAGRVRPIKGKADDWIVENERGEVYYVNGRCTCPDWEYRHKSIGLCKHQLAVEIVKQSQTEPQNTAGAPQAPAGKGKRCQRRRRG